MNKKFLAGAIVLACLCIISVAYACIVLDIDSDWRIYVGVDDRVYLYAWVNTGEPVNTWDWDWPAAFDDVGQNDSTYNSSSWGTSYTSGVYTIELGASGPYGTDYAYPEVYVIDVSLSSNSNFVALYEDEEDKLVQVNISLSPSQLNTGKVILEASGGISVWSDEQGNNQISLPATWYVVRDQVPSCVWVKGESVSSELNDASLDISYKTYWSSTLDEGSAEFTVIDVDITQPTGTNFDHQFPFDMSGPTGYCNIFVTGTTGFETLDADLKWTLTEIVDSNLTSDPDPADGNSVTFTYRGLPSSNSEFGEKTLTLEYSNTGIKDTKTIEIFFEPTTTNNPGVYDGKSKEYPYPNWFYYWAKPRGFYWGAGTKSLCGEYKPSDNTLWLFASAYTETEEPDDYVVDLYNHRYQTNINTSVNGIANTLENSISIDDANILYFLDTLHNVKFYSNPYSVAITGGSNDIIDTYPLAQGCTHNPTHDDDIIIKENEEDILHTGFDGILEILGGISPNDDPVDYEYIGQQKNINNGYGQPWYISITHGDDDWLQTNPEPEHGWDEIDLTGVEPVTFIRPKEWIGIDFVNVVCNHEMIHQDLYDEVRTGGGGNPPSDPYTYDHPDDNDDDFVHDVIFEGKAPYYLSPFNEDTYNMAVYFETGGDDNEFLCYMGQDDSSVDPNTDWSVRGKQWHKE